MSENYHGSRGLLALHVLFFHFQSQTTFVIGRAQHISRENM